MDKTKFHSLPAAVLDIGRGPLDVVITCTGVFAVGATVLPGRGKESQRQLAGHLLIIVAGVDFRLCTQVGVGIPTVSLGDIILIIVDFTDHHIAIVEGTGRNCVSAVLLGDELPFGLQTPCTHTLADKEVMFASILEVGL